MPNGRHPGKCHSWKDKRNYWKIHTQDGTVKYVIEVDGVRVEVSEDVYLAYSQMDRHSRYTEDEKGVNRKLSLEQMAEDEVLPGYAGITIQDVQTTFLKKEEKRQKKEYGIFTEAVESLSKQNQDMAYALFVQNMSGREYARLTGISEAAVSKRKKQILQKIKKFFLEKG